MTASIEQFLAAFSDEIAAKVTASLRADAPAPDRLLSVEETAERLGVAPRTIRGLKGDGKLAYVMVGGAVRFESSEIERYKASRRVAAR